MKRLFKKAFTLVELVVVIAIIAILSGVGVAVYVGLTNKAKATADSEIITQLNKHLKTQSVSEGRNVTCYDAYEDAFEIGFDLAKMTPSAGEYYVWDEVNDLFAVTNGDEVVAQDKDNSLTNIKYKRWIFTKTINPDETRSQYLTSKTYTGVANVKAGFDAGQNLNISEVNYVNDKASQEVIIRTTTFGTKVSVNGYVDTKDATHKTGDVVTHYGFAGLVDVVRCALSSYEEHGTIGRITANATADVIAHVAIKKDATVYQVVENEDDNSYITVDSGATVYDNEGNKIEGAVDSRNNAADDDMFAEDAKDCEHVDTHIFSDSQFMYEVCDTCGYTVITLIDPLNGTSKKDVVDENGGETIVPISTYTADGKTVKIEEDKVVITEEAEPTVPTPVVDPEQPITKCEHTFGEMEIIEEPTTEKVGSGKYTCTKCGYYYFQEIPTLFACVHEYHSLEEIDECLEDVQWLTITSGTMPIVFKATCVEDGIISKAHCKLCNKDITNISVPAFGHDNCELVWDRSIENPEVIGTTKIETVYCKRCHMPLAFVDHEDRSFIGNDYLMDSSYSFKSFSRESLVFKDTNGNVIQTQFSGLNIFDLMYGFTIGGKEYEPMMSDDLISILSGVKQLNSEGTLFADITDKSVRNSLLSSYKNFLSDCLDGTYFDLLMLLFGVNVDDENPLGAVKYFDWGADFEISFNKDVQSDEFGLGGYYKTFGYKLGFLASEYVTSEKLYAYNPVAMLGSVGWESGIEYSGILEWIGEFLCGIFNRSLDLSKSAIDASVSLFIKDPSNKDNKFIITTTKYSMEKTTNEIFEDFKDKYADYSTEDYYKIVTKGGNVILANDGSCGRLEHFEAAEYGYMNDKGEIVYGSNTFAPSASPVYEGSGYSVYTLSPINN